MVERVLALGSGDVTRVLDAADAITGQHEGPVTADDVELVEILIRGGREDLAGCIVDKLSTVPLLPLAAARLARCRGQLADDEAPFDEALLRFEALDMPLETARTQLCIGERRRRGGNRRTARTALRAALTAFDNLGAAGWADRTARELRAAGQQVRRGQVQVTTDLTPQEEQIARLVVEGRTNREVGSMLFISPKTVETHLSRIFRKLGVGSRMELARRMSPPSWPPGSGAPAD
jgi:DNA-binding CsgD family transcriptional regulator